MAGIRVESLKKIFGKFEALKQISLEVSDQEFVVLLGPSGCGKTTLLRCIAGLEHPDDGKVYIGEREVSRLPPRRRGIAMVFQNYAVFPHLTVYDNIAFGLRMRGAPRTQIKERVDEAASLMHIEELLERYPAQLSGGQRQRVAVARALATEPAVLLMDEPLSNLDALLRLEMRAELKRLLRQTRTTTLYVTHDQVEAMSLADRVAVMRAGEIVQYDTPLKIYQQPSDTFVGGFIGSPPMNFVRVRIEGDRGKTVARLDGASLPAPLRARGEALLGVRPEDLELLTDAAPDAFPGSVLVVEPLGPHLLLTVEVGGQNLKVATPPDLNVEVNARVWLRPNFARVRWMDAENGRALA